MPFVPGLRSPHARVGRLVVFGRMLDKIRLEARGELPGDYRSNLGDGQPSFFDGRCCRFLGLPYPSLRLRTLQGGCDEEILSWAHAAGAARSDEDCLIWNRYMSKIGWRDDRSETVREQDRVVVQIDSPGAVPGQVSGAAFAARGTARIAGLDCTQWATTDTDGRPTLACITQDGVLLQAASGDHVLLVAVEVRYAEQDAALFRVPEGYRRVIADPVKR